MIHHFFIILTLISCLIASALAETSSADSLNDSTHHNHDQRTPIGVMGGHTHEAGKWMASYRYTFMRMDQNYVGDRSVSDSYVISPTGGNFIITPQDMEMEMHMFSLMYAPTEKLTLMGMLSFVELSMNHNHRSLPDFKTESSGLGDSSVGGLYQFFKDKNQQAHIGLMLLLPTADIDNQDTTPLGFSQLPYPMQSGSGSWGLAPSLTWAKQTHHWSFGSQLSGKFYLTENTNDYRLGNRYEGTIWAARQLAPWLSSSLRFKLSHWENIHGQDAQIVTQVMGNNLVPTAETRLRGGTRVDASIGANAQLFQTGSSLGLELGIPLYQNLDGPQLGLEWFTTVGLQFTF